MCIRDRHYRILAGWHYRLAQERGKNSLKNHCKNHTRRINTLRTMWQKMQGLAEMMNYVGVVNGDGQVVEKLSLIHIWYEAY